MRTDSRTALGAARARFHAELGQRARELQSAVRVLALERASTRARQDLRRRLHSLLASAKLCEIGTLVRATEDALERLDHSAELLEVSDELLERMTALADSLPVLASVGEVPATGQVSDAAAVDDAATPGAKSVEVTQTVSGLGAPLVADAGDRWAGLESATVNDIAARVAEEVRRGIVESLQAGGDDAIDVGDASELTAAARSAVDRVRQHLVARSAGRVRFATSGPGPASTASRSSRLAGRTLLVADDDPVVLSFFSGLLRDAGARVLEAKNGREALQLARAERPEVVISDILMPRVDGFALCRELKRDLILSSVPVVLSSWKEDFLQRMRELQAGASGYLRKESGAAQVLAAVTEVLEPRLRLEDALTGGRGAQGKVEDTGLLVLVEEVAARLGDARLVVRDSWNVFEVRIEAGERIAATRTASDGSFARGDAALLQLAGVATGTFEAQAEPVALRGTGDGPVSQVLLAAAKRLTAIMDAVSDERLLRVASIVFDDAVLSALLKLTPTHVAYLVDQLRSGAMTARQLLATGQFPARELESQLLELARRGAIVAVRGGAGEDLVQEVLDARREDPGRLLHASLPPASGAASQAAVEAAGDELARYFSAEELSELAQAQSPAPFRAEARREEALDAELDAMLSEAPPAPSVRGAPPPSTVRVLSPGLTARRTAPAPAVSVAPPAQTRGVLGLLLSLVLLMGVGYYGWLTFYLRAPLPDVFPSPAADAPAAASTPTSTPTPPALPKPLPSEATAPPSIDVVPASVAAAAEPAATEAAEDGFGHALPFVDRSRGIEVAADEGLLVVEHEGRGLAPHIRVDAADLGRVPIATALPAGRHELVIDRGGTLSYRYLVIRPGETRVVELSTEP